ncbi:hypothetical protein LshimejAT787_0606500 [Lyophyllum shimeji]|uniref:Uncharacterized protein n=1 Tax=Lyophyllum shimeji TaxID=47721 RepID=A0A9P3UNB0_LYOSH|nr:hypothetical protein LshimejAT787_0606500 [Lyophyllum shimeji]
MMIRDVPRFRYSGRNLCAPAFKYWFDGMSLEEVKAKYIYSGIVDKDAVARTRFTTNKKKIPSYVNWTGALEPDLFDLGAQGNTTIPPEVDDGSDLEDMSPPPADSNPTANDFLSRVWRQFVVDVKAKSPNPRGNTNPSYLKLTTAERL